VYLTDVRHQHYYCFRCAARGDAITALMQAYDASFGWAVTQLAQRSNLPLPTTSTRLVTRRPERRKSSRPFIPT
jgi:DNA primase